VLNVTGLIQQRRHKQDLKQQKINHAAILDLLDAAIHGIAQSRKEHWAFVIIQDGNTLHRLFERASMSLEKDVQADLGSKDKLMPERFQPAELNGFYSDKALVAVCGKSADHYVASDCWQIARNLIIAAEAKGLESGVTAHLAPILNTAEWKQELDIASGIHVFVPLILRVVGKNRTINPRIHAEVISWK